jgi:hypothetical protein
MHPVEVTYWGSFWSPGDRRQVRALLVAAGVDVPPVPYEADWDDPALKGALGLVVPPELWIDVVEWFARYGPAELGALAAKAGQVVAAADNAVKVVDDFAIFIGAMAALAKWARERRMPINIRAPHRVYIVKADDDFDSDAAVKAIPVDFADGLDDRRGDMTWSEKRWLTVEEVHSPRRVRRARARRTGRPRAK